MRPERVAPGGEGRCGRQKLPAEHVAGEGDVIRADGVDAPGGEPEHQWGVVHGPSDDAAALNVCGQDERLVYEIPLAPEVAGVDLPGGACGVDGVAHLEHAAGYLRGEAAGLRDQSVVEAVDCGAGAVRVPRNALQRVRSDIASLEFHVDPKSGADRGEDLVERRDRLTPHTVVSEVGAGERLDSPQPGDHRVMVDHDDPVGGAVHVELRGIGTELHCPVEGGEGILRSFPGGPPVGDDLWDGHEPILTPAGCRRLIG